MFLIFLLISTNVSALYMAWHLFTLPNGFPQRESYIISFVMITLTVKELAYIKASKLLPVLVGLISLIIIGAELVSGNISLKILLINTLFILIYSLLFLFWKNDRNFKRILLTLISIECVVSGILINRITNFAELKPFYITNIAESNAIQKEKNNDSSIFRLGSSFQINTNDPMNYNYNGVSGYLSQLSTKQTNYLSYLGYYQKHSWFRWAQFNNGSTKALNSFLGIKYVLGGDCHINKMARNIESYPTRNDNVALDQYNKIDQIKGVSVYKNENAFPFVFISPYFKLRPNYNPSNNPFINYNILFKQFNTKKLYVPVKEINSQEILPGTNSFEKKSFQNDGLVYAYVASDRDEVLKNIKFNFNGKSLSYAGDNTNGENGIICLGDYKRGEHINLKVTNSNDKQCKLFVYQERNKPLKKMISFVKQKSGSIKNVEFKGDSLTFNTTSNFDGDYLTIPIAYQNGWSLLIDGQKQTKKIEKNFGQLMSIKAPQGKHKFKLIFNVPGLRISIIISILFLIGTLLYDFMMVRKDIGSVKKFV